MDRPLTVASRQRPLASGGICVHAGRRMDVLLVEDNAEVSLITVEYLTELGHQATAVAADKLSKKAEKKLSHPLLLRRLARAVAAR